MTEIVNRRIARFERAGRNEKPGTIKQIQASGGGGGSSSSSAAASDLYVKIIEGLSHDSDESTSGQSAYVCRLVGSTEPAAWAADGGTIEDHEIYPDGTYAVNASVLETDDRIYICTASEIENPAYTVGGEEPEYIYSGEVSPTATNGDLLWQVSEETPVYIWHEGATTTDMRQYIPWLKKGKVYPVRLYDGNYYFEQTFFKGGYDGTSNFQTDPDTLQVYVTVGDTFNG